MLFEAYVAANDAVRAIADRICVVDAGACRAEKCHEEGKNAGMQDPIPSVTTSQSLWDTTRPYVFAVGGHLLLLGLLFLGFLRQPQVVHETPAAGPSMVEATLVSGSPQTAIASGEPLHLQPTPVAPKPSEPQASPIPAPKQYAASQKETAPNPEKAAEQPGPPKSVAHQDQQQVDLSAQASRQDNTNPQGLAQQESADATDPFAEMRRQRAEAERRHQQEEEDIRQADEQRAQAAQAAMRGRAVAPAGAQVGNGGADQRIQSPLAVADPSDIARDWAPADLPQLTRCPIGAFRQGSGDVIPIGWVDCLLESPASIQASPAIDTFGG
jgi:hypothetical protein